MWPLLLNVDINTLCKRRNYYHWDRNQQTSPKEFPKTAIIKPASVMDFINILLPEDSQLYNNRSSLNFQYRRQEQPFHPKQMWKHQPSLSIGPQIWYWLVTRNT